MKTLPDEIAAALPALMKRYPGGPLADQAAEFVAADVPNTRAAFDALETDGRAKIVRRARGLHLVPADYPVRICIICKAEFTATRKETKTCSHSCARHLSWQNQEMRERHRESVRRSHARPDVKAKLTKRSRAYWQRQESREAASDAQRQLWRDSMVRGRRLVGIDKAWESQERREKQRARRLADWENPEFRAKAVEAMRNGKRGRFKRAVIALAMSKPNLTPAEIAKRFNKSVDSILHILRQARGEGLIGIRPGDGPRLRKRAAEERASA